MNVNTKIGSTYFSASSSEFLGRLEQVRSFIKNHNPTIGVLTEEVVREFLRKHLPTGVSVEQGFVLSNEGELSPQCDVLIYDSNSYAPFYRINEIVIVPAEAVVAIVEVKTTVNKSIFHKVIKYFAKLPPLRESARTYLFLFDSSSVQHLDEHFRTYEHPGAYQLWDHDTYLTLPDEIVGVNSAFHLRKALTAYESDRLGYESYFFEDQEGSDVHALQTFYLSVYGLVEDYLGIPALRKGYKNRADYFSMSMTSMMAIELFDA